MRTMLLKDRVAIVTGSGNGIGRAIASSMAGAGAKIIVSDVLIADGERVVKDICDGGGGAVFVPADVSQEKDVSNLVQAAVNAFGDIDILINNAGIGGNFGRAHEMSAADFDRVIGVNLRGTFLC